MPGIETHPTAEELSAFGLGRSSVGSRDAVEGHVRDCPECQARAAAVPDDRLLGLLRTIHAAGGVPGDTVDDSIAMTLNPRPAKDDATVGLPPGEPRLASEEIP